MSPCAQKGAGAPAGNAKHPMTNPGPTPLTNRGVSVFGNFLFIMLMNSGLGVLTISFTLVSVLNTWASSARSGTPLTKGASLTLIEHASCMRVMHACCRESCTWTHTFLEMKRGTLTAPCARCRGGRCQRWCGVL